MIVPYAESIKKKERKIGLLDGEINIRFSDDFKMTEEELIGMK